MNRHPQSDWFSCVCLFSSSRRFGSPREGEREQCVFSGAGPGPCSPEKSWKSLLT